jgi:hypothetical protein
MSREQSFATNPHSWRFVQCQDNCHLGGKTLDFGPFGFMEKYNPHYCALVKPPAVDHHPGWYPTKPMAVGRKKLITSMCFDNV